jgi:hypothetical protein
VELPPDGAAAAQADEVELLDGRPHPRPTGAPPWGKRRGSDDDDLHGAHSREALIRPAGISTGEEHGVRVSSLQRAALLAPPPCVLEELAELTVGFVVHVASICPTCLRCLTRMLQEFRADVAKVDLDFSTLRMLIPNTNV